MSKNRLGDYLQKYSVKNKKNLDYPVYSVTNSRGFCTEYFNKDVSGANKTTYKIVPRGYFAYNPSRINVGSVDWQNCEDNVIVSPLYVVFKCSKSLNQDYLKYFLKSNSGKRIINASISGSVRNSLNFEVLSDFQVEIRSIEEQLAAVNLLKKIEEFIKHEEHLLGLYDELLKSLFFEMFGDFRENTKNWPIAGFNEFATIDANMTSDYEKYADYPHIGIDSIEKDTGTLRGYRTVAQDGVISGKYIFGPQHIIYSKIRPNLNKVALPTFEGLCSADSYPILPKKGKCNRVFLAYNMRSKFFLDYILKFSARTNMPKVNRDDVSGFRTPLPPIDLQDDFSAVVERVELQKDDIRIRLEHFKELWNKITDELFNGESA